MNPKPHSSLALLGALVAVAGMVGCASPSKVTPAAAAPVQAATPTPVAAPRAVAPPPAAVAAAAPAGTAQSSVSTVSLAPGAGSTGSRSLAATPAAPAAGPAPAATAAAPAAVPAPAAVTAAPAAAVAALAAPTQRVVYFDFDSFVIRDDFKSLIEGHARVLARENGKRLVIEGHTDERGGREYNLALGQKRAEAVVRSLVLLGVADRQLEAVSFGEERPAAQGGDETAWSRNRRAELKDR